MKRNKLLLVGILFFSSLTHAQEYFGEDLINALAHGQDVYTFSHGFAAQTYPTADLEYDWNNCHLSTKVKLQLIEVQPLPTSMTLLSMDGHIVHPIRDTDDIRFNNLVQRYAQEIMARKPEYIKRHSHDINLMRQVETLIDKARESHNIDPSQSEANMDVEGMIVIGVLNEIIHEKAQKILIPNFAVQLRLLEDDPTDTWPEGMTPCKVGAEIWIQVHSRKITQYASYSSLVPFNPATPDYRVLNPAQWAKPMSNEVTNTPAQISNLEIMHIDDQNVCVSYQKKRNLKRYYPGFPNYYVLELDFDSQRNCRRFHMFYDSSRPGVNIEGAKNIFLQSRIWQD